MNNSGFLHGGEFFLGGEELIRIQMTRFRINRRTWIGQKMMADAMLRFQSSETVTAEQIREL